MRLLLDTNILTRLCHPAREENRPVVAWVEALLDSDANMIHVPEIADYEAHPDRIDLDGQRPCLGAIASLKADGPYLFARGKI